MTNIDQFESVFKAAERIAFVSEPVRIRAVMIVTGTGQAGSDAFDQAARGLLGQLPGPPQWQTVTGDQFDQVERLLALVEQAAPDLICTYRNLQTPAPDYPYSLGVYVDVLTQVAKAPVLLLPTPTIQAKRPESLSGRRAVMAITDHLTGDHHLVSYAAYFTEPRGRLLLTHVEDEAVFERYMETIAKIPAIDTDTARQTIREQLLKEPHDYVRSCRETLGQSEEHLQVEEIVTVGHRLMDYKRLVAEHRIDLLVMNTKDQDQLAMHGLAYPLAVELRETPLLLL